MKKAILVYRASTEEQGKKGNSLATQKGVCKTLATSRDFKVVAEYEEVITSFKNVQRGVLQTIFAKCKRRKEFTDYLLFQKVDRFFRNTQQAWNWIEKFKSIGVEVNFLEQWVDYEAGGAYLMLNLRLGLAQEESQNTSRRTKQNLSAIKEKGYFVGSKAPIGWTKKVLPNYRKTLIPDGDKLQVIAHILKSYLYGNVTRSYYLPAGKQIGFSSTQFYVMFQNPVYAGLNRIGKRLITADWNEYKAITKEEFILIQDKIEADKKTQSKTITVNEFWLKGHLFNLKGQRYSASYSTGRKKKYPYYNPMRAGEKSIPAKKAHDFIYALFEQIKIKPLILNYIESFDQKSKELLKARNQAKTNLQRDIKAIEEREKQLKKEFALGNIEITDYKEYKEITATQKEEKYTRIEKLDADLFVTKKNVLETIELIKNLPKLIKSPNFQVKNLILRSFFPFGFYIDLEKRILRTAKVSNTLSEMIDLESITNLIKIEKGEKINSHLSGVADGCGLETIEIVNINKLIQITKTA